MGPSARQSLRARSRLLPGILITAVVALSVLLTPTGVDSARAADLSQFQAGNIISDVVFFNSGSMSQAEIQSFLQGKETNCAPSATCVKDYYTTTATIAGDAMCKTYSGGGSERASAIIYKVAQACGINPQVLLVTMQKEQGLITSVWPSDYSYKYAMGADCPDTTGCAGVSASFFAQVYKSAWQLKRYANPPGTSNYFTWYAPGHTWNIRYSPNTACGSAPVYVQNQATADLYYYTPYQPNAAALRAGYGSGDSCSAYGNRNFYNYFTDWFGSTQRDYVGEINAEYAAQGGAASLGAAITGITQLYQNGGGYGQAFANGSIYWQVNFGAKTVRVGPLRDYYFARSGADGDMGWPVLDQVAYSFASGAGIAQLFSAGSLYSSAAGTYIVREPIRSGYFTVDGAAGQLGWPTTDQSCTGGVCTQNFVGGVVVSSGSGSYPVTDPVRAAWVAAGGVTGSWGVPVSGPSYVPSSGGGYGQSFANLSVYYRADGPVQSVSGAILNTYLQLGAAAGSLGFPAGAMTCSDASTCQQQFQFGWILWTASGGTRIGDPAIDQAYAAAGGPAGLLGVQTNPFVYYAFNGGGFAEGFANGAIFYKPSVGAAYPVTGAARTAYFAAGGAAGKYGWPISKMTCAGTTCSQNFEGGLVITGPGGAQWMVDPMRAPYVAAGGPTGSWGAPVTGLTYLSYFGGGYGQAFANGSAYYRGNGPAYYVTGPIRDKYFQLGGAAGSLGYPAGAMTCADASTCQQQFQFGWILWTASAGARIGDPAIDRAYAAAGGPTGALGAQTSPFVYYAYNGGGFAEGFANGAIFYKPSVGTAYALSGGVRNAYFAAGGAAGRYGWPTSAMNCTATTCTQNFEGGTVTAAP